MKGVSYLLKIEAKVFTGSHEEFYSMMGKFFAEPDYKKQMPYMCNKSTHVWILAFHDQKVVGFGAINELNNKIVFESSFVEHNYRRTGIWKLINKERFEYIKGRNKRLEVITKEEHLKNYWFKKGFKVSRQNGKYFYLRKDV